MNRVYDNLTAYGEDQDREPTNTALRDDPRWAADFDSDDFGPESIGRPEINPDTGLEFGAVDSTAHLATR